MTEPTPLPIPPTPPFIVEHTPAPTGWADVADTALHYLAGLVVLGAVGFFAYQKLVAPDTFIAFATAAAGAVGFKFVQK